MSDKINVQNIFNKYGININLFDQNDLDKFAYATKEIVEAVVDKCAEEAEAIEGYNTGYSGSAASVDKDSILKVKNMIDYE